MTARNTARTKPEPLPIHTALTLDDRDDLDTLRIRIEQRAMLLQHILSAEADPDGVLTDREKALLEGGLIELTASILADADRIRGVLDAAEHRRPGGAQ
jgi:hypothetical protein